MKISLTNSTAEEHVISTSSKRQKTTKEPHKPQRLPDVLWRQVVNMLVGVEEVTMDYTTLFDAKTLVVLSQSCRQLHALTTPVLKVAKMTTLLNVGQQMHENDSELSLAERVIKSAIINLELTPQEISPKMLPSVRRIAFVPKQKNESTVITETMGTAIAQLPKCTSLDIFGCVSLAPLSAAQNIVSFDSMQMSDFLKKMWSQNNEPNFLIHASSHLMELLQRVWRQDSLSTRFTLKNLKELVTALPKLEVLNIGCHQNFITHEDRMEALKLISQLTCLKELTLFGFSSSGAISQDVAESLKKLTSLKKFAFFAPLSEDWLLTFSKVFPQLESFSSRGLFDRHLFNLDNHYEYAFPGKKIFPALKELACTITSKRFQDHVPDFLQNRPAIKKVVLFSLDQEGVCIPQVIQKMPQLEFLKIIGQFPLNETRQALSEYSAKYPSCVVSSCHRRIK